MGPAANIGFGNAASSRMGPRKSMAVPYLVATWLPTWLPTYMAKGLLFYGNCGMHSDD